MQELKERNQEIYEVWKQSKNYSEVARKFNKNVSVIWRIVQRYQKLEANNAT